MTDSEAQSTIGHRQLKSAVSVTAALISTVNILGVIAVAVLPQVGRLLVAGSSEQLWYFAVVAGVSILVLSITWPRALRVPPGRLRILRFSLSSGSLLALSLLTAVSIFAGLAARHPVRSVYVAEAWPEWLCVVAAALAFVRLELDPRPVTLLTPLLTCVPDPARSARVFSVVSVTAFLAAMLLTIVGGLPGVRVPLAALYVQPAVLLIVTVASLFKRNRWAPVGRFADIRAVTPAKLSLIALASVFVQLPLALLVARGEGGISPSYFGILLLFVVSVIGILGLFRVRDDGPTKPGKRRRGAAPLIYVGKLAQVEVAPVAGWAALPNKFPANGYKNATAWATGMLPQFSAEIGTGTDEQKQAFARSVVTLINSRLKLGMSVLFLKLEEWEGPYLVAGLSDEFSQLWQGMPVHDLVEEIASEHTASPVLVAPLTAFTTTSGLDGRRRIQADRVDYWVTVDGGWAHISCTDQPDRIAGALPQLDALASAIFIGNRVVGRRKQPAAPTAEPHKSA